MEIALKRGSAALMLTVGAALFVGCASAPPGDPGGRLDVYETKHDEKKSGQVNLASMSELGDRAAEEIVMELPRLKVADPAAPKHVIYIGEFENHTSRTSSADFELFMKRLKSRLVNEPSIREHFEIRNEPIATDRIRSRFTNEPPAADGAARAGTQRVDPRFIYVLNGNFNDAVRNGKTQFFLEFQLVELDTGEVEISVAKDLAQAN